MNLAQQIEEFRRLDAEAQRLIQRRNEFQAALIEALDKGKTTLLEGYSARSEAEFAARIAVVRGDGVFYVAVLGAEPEATPTLESGLSICHLSPGEQ